ncbi:MAG: methyl-accepting chemotaxis protein [Cellvibrionaceae bacterium]|jgi:methyl-accepting chemotaxis protein
MLLKHKFIAVCIVVLASMLFMIALGSYKTNKIQTFSELSLHISQVESAMLQLRRNEKDFLARNDLKYHSKFQDNMAALNTRISSLEQSTRKAELDTNKVSEMKEAAKQYQAKFNTLVEEQKAIGLNPKDGLYGGLREAVHAAEKEIKAADNQRLRADMLQLRRNEKDFMLRNDTKYIESFSKNITVFNNSLAASEIPADNRSVIKQSMQEYQKKFTALTAGYIKKGLNSNEGVRGELRAIIHTAETLLSELSQKMQQTISNKLGSIDRLSWTIALIGLALTALSVGAIAWIVTGVLRSLQQLMNSMLKARTTNDLTLRASVNSRDEIGTTADTFNKMMENFQSIIELVSRSSTHIATATEEMSITSTRTNEKIQNQKDQTRNLATAMNEMAATVSHVAENTSSASETAKSASQECAKGKEVVTVAEATMDSLAKSVQKAADAISLVEDDSNSIGSVLDVIRGIAEQTNLLALNAAIEAARAGEQGRGFAVVADEVRTLAGRTQDSTQEIQQMIESLQARSEQAVSLMAESHRQAQTGVEQTASVNRALSSIVDAVNQINGMNTQIATAANQQSQVTEEVNRNVVSIDQVADESSLSAQEIATASNDLAKLATELQTIARQFKV